MKCGNMCLINHYVSEVNVLLAWYHIILFYNVFMKHQQCKNKHLR